MADKLSEAAGRVVGRLSRRRFLTRVGGGGALATGLGLGAFPAAAQAVQCNAMQHTIPITPGNPQVARVACVDPGHCHFASDAVLQNFCGLRTSAACGQATDCPPPHVCSPIAEAGNNVVVDCHAVGQPGARGCPPGQVLCQCTVRVRGGFPGGNVVCRCNCH
jgi:hypothetical protein